MTAFRTWTQAARLEAAEADRRYELDARNRDHLRRIEGRRFDVFPPLPPRPWAAKAPPWKRTPARAIKAAMGLYAPVTLRRPAK